MTHCLNDHGYTRGAPEEAWWVGEGRGGIGMGWGKGSVIEVKLGHHFQFVLKVGYTFA